MKPVYQTIHGKSNGNCFAACIASILELDLEDVPHFCKGDNPRWMFDLNEWLYQFGLGALTVAFQGEIPLTKGWCCAGGKAPNGIKHSVVLKDLKFVHDPHEGWNGFEGDPEDYTFIIVLNPESHLEKIGAGQGCRLRCALRDRPSVGLQSFKISEVHDGSDRKRGGATHPEMGAQANSGI